MSEDYDRAFRIIIDKMLKSDIAKYKNEKTYEKAKQLSVNEAFQARVKRVRSKWQIKPRLPPTDGPDTWLSEYILEMWAHNTVHSEADLHKLEKDLENELCEPFGLNYFHDRGLIIAAICFDLTPENVINHWPEMQVTIARDTSPGATVVLDDVDTRMRQQLVHKLIIVYLLHILSFLRIPLTNFPSHIKDQCQQIENELNRDGKGLRPTVILKMIIWLTDNASELPQYGKDLLVRIEPNTTLADVRRMWPQVENRKLEVFGPTKPKKSKSWTTFERDVELTRLYSELDDYSEVVCEYDRQHMLGERLVNDDNYIKIRDDVLDLVRQAVRRTKRRMTAKRIG